MVFNAQILQRGCKWFHRLAPPMSRLCIYHLPVLMSALVLRGKEKRWPVERHWIVLCNSAFWVDGEGSEFHFSSGPEHSPCSPDALSVECLLLELFKTLLEQLWGDAIRTKMPTNPSLHFAIDQDKDLGPALLKIPQVHWKIQHPLVFLSRKYMNDTETQILHSRFESEGLIISL